MSATATVPLSMSPSKRRRGELLVAGAQHIGGADIAGADRAQVLRAGEPRQDDAERDGAAQIAEHESCETAGSCDMARTYIVIRGGRAAAVEATRPRRWGCQFRLASVALGR